MALRYGVLVIVMSLVAWPLGLSLQRTIACSSPPRLPCPDLERHDPTTDARLETTNTKRQTSMTEKDWPC
jgi:hypothetical protein